MAGAPPPGPYQQGNGYPPPPGGYQQQPGYVPPPAGGYGPQSGAPYGVHPRLGVPYSDKSKVVAGILQLVPLLAGIGGIGRIYMGHVGIGIAQLLLCFVCVGWIWSLIDGILILVNDDIMDPNGLPLKPN